MATGTASGKQVRAGRMHEEVELLQTVGVENAKGLHRARKKHTKGRSRFPVDSGTLSDSNRSFLRILNCGSPPHCAMSSTYWDSEEGSKSVSHFFSRAVLGRNFYVMPRP
jgi:hypothetical protein